MSKALLTPTKRRKMEKSLYRVVKIKLHFPGKILAGVPKDEEEIKIWTELKGGEFDKKTEVYHSEKEVEEDKKITASGFRLKTVQVKGEEKKALAIHGLQIRGMIKSLLPRIGLSKGKGSIFGIRSASETIVIKPDLIPFTRNEEYLFEPDGIETWPGRIKGPMGDRSIINIKDYAEDVDVEFEAWLRQKDVITPNILLEIMVAAEEVGLGSSRQMGFGRFTVVEMTQDEDED